MDLINLTKKTGLGNCFQPTSIQKEMGKRGILVPHMEEWRCKKQWFDHQEIGISYDDCRGLLMMANDL